MEKQSFKGVPESNWVVGPCRTEEIAKQVLAVAHAYGWKWCSGNLFIDKTNWNQYKKGTYYNIAIGEYCDFEYWKSRKCTIISPDDFEYWKSRKCTIISPETFLANNQMPGEKLEEKTRKPGVKYTLEDWKKEADACRKRAEYWKNKLQISERTLFDSNHHNEGVINKLKLDLEHTNKNFKILQTENKVLKESNENLRNTNYDLSKSFTEASQELGFAKLKIQDIEKERDELGNGNDLLLKSLETASKDLEIANEELKTVKSHLELRIKGIQALEEDAKRLTKANYELTERVRNSESQNRKDIVEIQLLKSDFETKNSELEILEEDYNCLKDVQKYTKVVGWAGWIFFFIALFGLMFYKG